ncbi:MAG: hypothetical protein SVS15_07965, partial [Thermodesulfobacteriota bacterium]|nr:hypothetical protein [Thermodesulfobacteriota bacterium]
CGTPLETHSAKQVNNFYILRNFFYKCGRKYVANNGVGGRCIEISGIQGSQNHRTNHHVAYNMAYDCQGFLGANQASPLFIYNNIALNVGYGFWFFNQSKPLQVTLENNVVRGLNPDQPKAYGGENKAPHFVNYTCWAKGSYLKSRNNLFFDSRIKSGLTFCSPSGSYRNTAVKKFDLGLTIASGSEGKGDRFSDPKCKVSVPSGADRVSQVSLRLSPDSPLPGAGIPVEVESYPSSDIFHTEIRKDNVPIGAYLPAN